VCHARPHGAADAAGLCEAYRQVLRWQPYNSDAYHLFGILAGQLIALSLFEHAIVLNAWVPEYYTPTLVALPQVREQAILSLLQHDWDDPRRGRS
jgi:hypothetical protein